MNNAMAKSYIKNHLDDYLSEKGIDVRKPFRCLNPLHNDQNPSMSYDRKRAKAHCFACGADYDTFDVIGIDYDLQEYGKIFGKAYSHFGISVGEEPETDGYAETCHGNVHKTEYFRSRGLGEGVIKRFKLGYDEAYSHGTGGSIWKAAIIPTGKDTFTARNTDINADKANRIRKQGGSPVFNFDNSMNETGVVFIVEGELDALSVFEAGGYAVALGSTANIRQLVSLFKGWFLDFKGDKISAIHKPIVISLDNDEEGERASVALLEALGEIFDNCIAEDISLGHKDPNEALVCDREAFVARVWSVAELYGLRGDGDCGEKEDYIRSSAAFALKDFRRRRHDEESRGVSTGFSLLDVALGGSLFNGLHIIGAISSLGKTTFILQMADNMAACGEDTLIFSLEMSARELIAKSVSRHTLLECLGSGSSVGAGDAKTALEVMRGVPSGYGAAMDAYAAYARNVYINEKARSVEDVRLAVERHISLTGRKPVVFVDYIQILDGGVRGTDKQHMDRNVTELKRVSRDFGLPVVGVSSFNRQSYREAVTMEAFKESGAIEYSSDVLIGLQLAGVGRKDFDADKEKMKNPRAVELKVLKNRNGRVGEVVSYCYYPEFNYFREG